MSLSGSIAPPVLETASYDDSNDTDEARAQKRAKEAALHEDYSAPLSFLEDAVSAAQTNSSFNISDIGEPYGLKKEAYVRRCYEDIAQSIAAASNENMEKKKQLFIIRGSSGIGKSTFLTYCVVRLRDFFGKTILCHAQKSFKNNENENAICQVWDKGTKLLEGNFRKVQEQLDEHMPTTKLIMMDGCSLPLHLAKFKGTVLMAASPSLYVKNLEDAVIISRRKSFTMPALSDEEALAIAAMIGVDESVVKSNLLYMGGVTRYLFEPGIAKLKVEEAVTHNVNASSITRMVSMQARYRAADNFMVHSLVLWKVDVEQGRGYDGIPRFELVSRYAECLVAKKLALEAAETLKAARRSMAPMSGAEGYAGALFEAYAIRTLQAGGTFTVRSLNGKPSFSLKVPPMGAPVVIETNTLSTADVPYNRVRVADGTGSFTAILLWPTTTNFPTFDCFYFHTDGKVYPLQMTIAEIHNLKNSGAFNAKKYFDGLPGSGNLSTYPAVFVVPVEAAPTYVAQKFTGNVNKAPLDMAPHFDQWVLGI